MKQLSLNFPAPSSRGDISVGSKVSCRWCEATGTVKKIYGKSLSIKRDDKYITRYRRPDGSVYLEYDTWVGRVAEWAVVTTAGDEK